jgi:hypothetical protein
MTYTITDYTKKRAKEIGVEVKPASNPKKKLDVYKDGKRIATIGDSQYGDYPTFVKEKGTQYANERRRLYHLRHTKDTLGERLARVLLW